MSPHAGIIQSKNNTVYSTTRVAADLGYSKQQQYIEPKHQENDTKCVRERRTFVSREGKYLKFDISLLY